MPDPSKKLHCDGCYVLLSSGDGWRCPPSLFNKALRLGFEPDEETIRMVTEAGRSRQQALELWRAQCSLSQTDWLLCSRCQDQASRLLDRSGEKEVRDNRWKHGTGSFSLPPLPESLQGSIGCMFQEVVFDLAVGSEVCIVILEDMGNGGALAAIRPFNLLSKQGMVRTNHGMVAFIVWTAAGGSPKETHYEQFLNPHNLQTVHLLKKIGRQIEIKVIVLNSTSSEIHDLFILPNNYNFDKIAAFIEQNIKPDMPSNFQLAQKEMCSRYSLDDLMRMS